MEQLTFEQFYFIEYSLKILCHKCEKMEQLDKTKYASIIKTMKKEEEEIIKSIQYFINMLPGQVQMQFCCKQYHYVMFYVQMLVKIKYTNSTCVNITSDL